VIHERAGASVAPGAPLLEVRHVSKQFRGVRALDDVSFTLNEGEILALVGENGAGKSTLIKTLAGAHNADSGEVLMNGEHVDLTDPLEAEQRGVVTVYQELNLFPELSVAENLLFGHYPKRGPFVDWRKVRQEARQFLAGLGVHVPVDRLVSSLSIADQQLVEIAKALHQKARILILDEPTAVLGGEDAEALMRIVINLKDHGVAVIFISHRLDEVFGFADRYVVLKDGKQAGSGLISETNRDDLIAKMVGRELVGSAYRSSTDASKQEVLDAENLLLAPVSR